MFSFEIFVIQNNLKINCFFFFFLGTKNKRLKKSQILDDLGREEDDLRMDVGTES